MGTRYSALVFYSTTDIRTLTADLWPEDREPALSKSKDNEQKENLGNASEVRIRDASWFVNALRSAQFTVTSHRQVTWHFKLTTHYLASRLMLNR